MAEITPAKPVEVKKPERIILRLKGAYKGINSGEIAGFDPAEARHILSQKIRDHLGNEYPAAELYVPPKAEK